MIEVRVAASEIHKGIPISAGERYRVIVSRAMKLRIKLLTIFGESRAGVTCTFTVNGIDTEAISDESGIAETEIAPDTRSALLVADNERYELVIGELEPIDTPCGLHARLRNLGYDLDDDDDKDQVDSDQLQYEIGLFQYNQQLPITGEADDLTKQEIKLLADP